MVLSRLLWVTRCGCRCVPQGNGALFPYNKYFIVQLVLPTESAGSWPLSFFPLVFMNLDFVLVYERPKKEHGHDPAILPSRLVNKPLLLFGGSANEWLERWI